MKRIILPLVLLFIMSTALSTQSYEDLWKQVQTAQEKDHPRQVIDLAQQIYDKANREQDYAQLLKSWVTLIETKCDLDPDSFNIAQVKPLPHEGPVQTALYDAVMASAYLAMKDSHTHDFDADTQAEYSQQARRLFAEALADKESLARECATNYLPLVEIGDDSRLYGHDLLSLLTHFTLAHSEMSNGEKAELCGSVAQYYQEHGNREGQALMRLQQLPLLRNHEDYNLRLSDSAYIEQLHLLVDETRDLDAGADVAEQYFNNISDQDERIDFARWAVKQFPEAYNAGNFTAAIDSYLRPGISGHIPSGILVGRPFDFSINFENITEASLEIRRYNGKDKKDHLRTDGALIDSRRYTLGDDSLSTSRRLRGYPTRGDKTDTFTLPAGHYVFVLRSQGKEDVEELTLTSLRLLVFNLPRKKQLAMVVNNETGRPVPKAEIVIKRYDKETAYPVGKNGEYIFDAEGSRGNLKARIPGTDDCTSYLWDNYHNYTNSKVGEHRTCLFTDRSIYRPGQTVHVAGICYQQTGDDTHVSPQTKLTLALYDANYRKVQEQKVTSNQLGSFDADFTLPQGLLPGQFSIQSVDKRIASVSFRVEEYKRPTFDVNATHAASGGREFTFGDTIQVEATATTYSGVPVQEARVHYKVETARMSFWFWSSIDWECISEADTLTNEEGKAIVPLFLDPKKLDDEDGKVRYRVTFDVTDQAGETHSTTYVTSLSHQAFGLSIQASQVIDLASPTPIVIKARNASDEEVAVTGSYIIYNKEKEHPLYRGSFVSGEELHLPSLTSGDYHIEATATDRNGLVITTHQNVSLFDSRLAIEILAGRCKAGSSNSETLFDQEFCQVIESEFSDEKAAQVVFSPSQQDVWLGYMILSNDKVIERHQLTVGRKLYRLTIPYNANYGDGVTLCLYYVRDGKCFQKQTQLTYVRPDKRLQLSWSTFRDRLYPGQEEVWTLTIRDPKGQPVHSAELLATMYDASLDQFASLSWPFSISCPRNVSSYGMFKSSGNTSVELGINSPYDAKPYSSRDFDELTQYVHQRWARRPLFHMMRTFGASANRVASLANASVAMEDNAMSDDNTFVGYSTMSKQSIAPDMLVGEEAALPAEMAAMADASAGPAIRTNFAETAFFYPHLLSDDKGEVRIGFTLPESLTEWKFMGLAHDSLVNYGSITATAVARKEFMVQPNMPRFVREGDHASIAARIINQGEHYLEGTAQLRLLDPDTEAVVYTVTLPFSLDPDKTTSVAFPYEVTDRYPLLICEVSATGHLKTSQPQNLPGSSPSRGTRGDLHNLTTFSDGERNYLPVLSSRKYITEAIPFYVTSADAAKDIDISSLFNDGSPTATHRRLLLEYTTHPEWTLIEALDGIKLPETECATCYSASLYANLMARAIALSIPGFHEALLAAKRQQEATVNPVAGDAAAPSTQFTLNDELRDILLKESPWVNDALQETEQRARLIDLFDDVKMSERILKATERLRKLQQSDGGWCWFEGMKSSYYVTLSVCDHLTHLLLDVSLLSGSKQSSSAPDNGNIAAAEQLLSHGLAFLDQQELKDYQYRIDHKLPITLDDSALDYLYLCAQNPSRKVSKNCQKMRDAYIKELRSSVRDLTIHGRSVVAVVLRAFGQKSAADDFLESVVEYTIQKPGMGRYYATDIAYYSWRDYRIPTQIAAMQAISLSNRKDRQSLLRDMQIWLLRQKQTQTWDNPLNTVSALSLLLNLEGVSEASSAATGHREPRFVNHTSACAFTLDGRALTTPIDTTRFLAEQLGYIRTDIELPGEPLHTLCVKTDAPEAERPSISWGALYAQYLEQMDRLQSQSTGELRVAMKLLDAEGHDITPASTSVDDRPLHVGDRVTLRLVITADRDMDFVQVRAQHPACFEPTDQRSGYRWMGGRGGYVAQHDASTDIFFDRFTKGTTTYDIPFTVDRIGQYLTGIATAQCAYAPEFVAHSSALRINVIE